MDEAEAANIKTAVGLEEKPSSSLPPLASHIHYGKTYILWKSVCNEWECEFLGCSSDVDEVSRPYAVRRCVAGYWVRSVLKQNGSLRLSTKYPPTQHHGQDERIPICWTVCTLHYPSDLGSLRI